MTLPVESSSTPDMSKLTTGQLRDVLLYSDDKAERARAVQWFEFRIEQQTTLDMSRLIRGAA